MKTVFLKVVTGCLLIIFYFVLFLIFNGNHKWILLFTLCTSFLISFFLFHKESNLNKVEYSLIFVLPIILLFTVSSFFVGFTYSISYILFIPLSVVLGKLFSETRFYLVIGIVSLSIFIFSSFVFLENVIVYSSNIGARVNKVYRPITLIDKNRDTIELNKEKIIVLDFWTTSCKICYEKFPNFEKNFLLYKDDNRVQFYSVNVPLKNNNFKKTVTIVENLGYDFPTIYASSEEEVNEVLDINSYPKLIILAKGNIRYNGRFESDAHIFIGNFKNELRKLLNEF
ncbi:TlpA family protein disulfide reductase [Maribacter polysaccharolyticus]|uniref:TlpA family protein disulfide reductase n=1 Tax=Maribacter polysaccharolyticus TaxID=3020831 RepID=UPI00237F605E|nr:hypothetical protein [Maribacter polysaccharolyticus]MDE3743994.1 hypothetical protein [Maribacter polysaccharolyticus]